jgi:DNA polymerase-3 subunit delta
MSRSARQVLEAIHKGTIAPGYLLMGRELYWRDRIWSALRRAVAPGDSGISEFDLRSMSLEAVLSTAQEGNLWAPRQLVLVRNAQTLTAARGLPNLREYFQGPSPAVVVLEMTDVDLGSDDWREREKAKGRLEAWDGLCEVVLLARPPLGECRELIQHESRERGRSISPEAAESLAVLFDCDVARIVNEVEKLCLHDPTVREISREEVTAVAGAESWFAGQTLTEAIGSGRPAHVFEALAHALRQDVYLPLLVVELARYLRQLLLLREENARDTRQAARILWEARQAAPQAALPELVRQSRAFSRDHLIECLTLAQLTDLALRSSPVDARLVMERYLLRIMEPLSPRPARDLLGS